MTMYLTHLTRPPGDGSTSVDILLKILSEGTLLGSSTDSGFIVGSNKAVCFQELPLTSLVENVYHEETNKNKLGGKTRYEAVGLAFHKPYAYRKGARPVIYERTSDAKRILSNEDEYWRIVNFDLSDGENIIDWTHEREWRIKGDFEFELPRVTVILPTTKSYKRFIEKADKEILSEIAGIVCLSPILF